MKKQLKVFTFMSWLNEEWNDNEKIGDIRAIALCDCTGYFHEAINCLRDGAVGKKDENGVYERHWYEDNLYCYGDETASLRHATNEEIELYLQYVPLEKAIGGELCEANDISYKIVDKRISPDYNFDYILVEYSTPLWKRIKNWLFRWKRLPF